MTLQIATADVLDWAASYEGPAFHALLTDCPYEMEFMGKEWDGSGVSFQSETWAALAKHLLPGAFLMVFAGTLNDDLISVAMRQAGLRKFHKALAWAYGSGFPKATRIDTAIDKAAGAERDRKIVGYKTEPNGRLRITESTGTNGRQSWGPGAGFRDTVEKRQIIEPATPLAQTWAGHRYGLQALKPAAETILIFQKPYQGKPVDSIVETGAGALWVDGGRIGTSKDVPASPSKDKTNGIWSKFEKGGIEEGDGFNPNIGRWPSNFVLSHLPTCRKVGTRRVKGTSERDRPSATSGKIGNVLAGSVEGSLNRVQSPGYAGPDGLETIDAWECADGCPVRALGEQSGERPSGGYPPAGNVRSQVVTYGKPNETGEPAFGHSEGTAARFFFQAGWEYEIAEPFGFAQGRQLAQAEPFYYCAKASRAERDAGLRNLPAAPGHVAVGDMAGSEDHGSNLTDSRRHNPHPTVKPIALTRYLATLLLPPAAYAPRRMLVPFAGVGSEMIGAGLAGWEEIVGIEKEAEYAEIGQARLKHWLTSMQMEMQL